MEYQQLGKSALSVSRIGFGCMSLPKTAPEAVRLLQQAVDKGITYFDTADMYDKGANETFVGEALKNVRQQVVIATKVGNQWRPDGSGWDWNPRKEYITAQVEQSLRRLQTDYIDLYQLHGGTLEDPIDEVIETFETLQQQGKIRYYGISSIRPSVIRVYVSRSQIVSVMMQYSLLDRRPEETALPLLQEHNIGVLARGSVASGLLAGKPAKPYLQYTAEQVQQAAHAIEALSGPERTAAQTAIRFALHQPAISAAVVGIRTQEQLEEAIQTSETPPITDQELAGLTGAISVNRYDQHR